MSIEIYDKAKIIEKDNTFYYLIKHGSKNSYTCPFQKVIDNNLNNHYIRRQSRDSHWSIIAYGDDTARLADFIADTTWNATTAMIYGQVRFAKHQNIALYFAKNKNNFTSYSQLDEIQQCNFDSLFSYHKEQVARDTNSVWCINLNDIRQEQKLKVGENYCGDTRNIAQHSIIYQGMPYWQLNNL